MEFGAPYDRTAKILTGIVCALLLSVPLFTGTPHILAISALVIGASFAWSPKSYTILGRTLTVKRWVGNARVPLDDLRELRRATADDLRGCLRLFGSGGLFGYFGLFRTSKLGKGWWYATNRQNMVVVITGGQTVLVSPDDVDGFLSMIGPATGSTDVATDSAARHADSLTEPEA